VFYFGIVDFARGCCEVTKMENPKIRLLCLCKRLKSESFHPLTVSDFCFNIEGNQPSMSKKKVKSKEDFINEPKVVALPGQTYSYGQTPAALCR
jgi:hypothetical protein